MKKNNKKGFTLAELLIVVAIIAVLTAIPVFTTQLEKSREATDAANIRSAYAVCSAALLVGESDTPNGVTFTEADGTNPAKAVKTNVAIKQAVSGWASSGEIAGKKYGPSETGIPSVTSSDTVTITVNGDGTWTCVKGT